MLIVLSCAFGPSEADAVDCAGDVRVSGETVGEYAVTVLTCPVPLRAGTVEVNILVLDSGGASILSDLNIQVVTDALGNQETSGLYGTGRTRSANRLFHTALVDLSAEGQWEVTVQIDGPEGHGDIVFVVEAVGPGLLDKAGSIIWITAAILGIGLLAWLFVDRGNQTQDAIAPAPSRAFRETGRRGRHRDSDSN